MFSPSQSILNGSITISYPSGISFSSILDVFVDICVLFAFFVMFTQANCACNSPCAYCSPISFSPSGHSIVHVPQYPLEHMGVQLFSLSSPHVSVNSLHVTPSQQSSKLQSWQEPSEQVPEQLKTLFP